jgi:hypothetical protein
MFERIKILFIQKNRQFIQAILIIFLVCDYNTDMHIFNQNMLFKNISQISRR